MYNITLNSREAFGALQKVDSKEHLSSILGKPQVNGIG